MMRKMGNIEQAQTLVNEFASMAAVGVLRLHHFPSPEQVQHAFKLLQKRHPLLQTQISQQPDGFFFETVVDCPPISVTVIDNAHNDAWLSVVQEALNRKVPNQAPLLHSYYLQLADTTDTADLVTVFHHAMMDAFSGINLLEELLLILSGEWEAPLETMPLSAPCEEHFPPMMQGVRGAGRLAGFMLRQMGDELSFRMKSHNGRIPPIHPSANCIPLMRTLSVTETRTLSKVSRQHNVTLNSVVATAQLLALHIHRYQKAAQPLRTMIFANLRPYLHPPIPANILGCYITPTRQTVPLTSIPAFWDVAQTIQENMSTAMRRGDGFLNALLSKQLVQMVTKRQSERLAASAISYVGVLNMRPQYGHITVVQLHAFLANNRLGPEFTAFCQIFQGQLSWDFVYLDADMNTETAVAIADETCAILRELTDEHST